MGHSQRFHPFFKLIVLAGARLLGMADFPIAEVAAVKT